MGEDIFTENPGLSKLTKFFMLPGFGGHEHNGNIKYTGYLYGNLQHDKVRKDTPAFESKIVYGSMRLGVEWQPVMRELNGNNQLIVAPLNDIAQQQMKDWVSEGFPMQPVQLEDGTEGFSLIEGMPLQLSPHQAQHEASGHVASDDERRERNINTSNSFYPAIPRVLGSEVFLGNSHKAQHKASGHAAPDDLVMLLLMMSVVNVISILRTVFIQQYQGFWGLRYF